ncbi:MAG: hypothetical protein N2560_08675 [Ignavibacteria bacterium]|nr:hypothetical protein [Ignavibacteria bacterium]
MNSIFSIETFDKILYDLRRIIDDVERALKNDDREHLRNLADKLFYFLQSEFLLQYFSSFVDRALDYIAQIFEFGTCCDDFLKALDDLYDGVNSLYLKLSLTKITV